MVRFFPSSSLLSILNTHDIPIETANTVSETLTTTRETLLDEGFKWLKKLSTSGHPESQYFLATFYAADSNYDKAFPLYVLSAKHHHAIASYEAACCYELGRGTKKDNSRAVQFYRKAASGGHKRAMYRMGVACITGEIGMRKDVKESLKWLKRAAAVADSENPEAVYELARLFEIGCPPAIHQDESYAASLYLEAAQLGFSPAQYKCGVSYEYGKLGLPVAPSESLHWFMMGAQAGDPECQFSLAGWYLTGAEGVLPQSDLDAYNWVKCAAEKGLPKAEFAMGTHYYLHSPLLTDLSKLKHT